MVTMGFLRLKLIQTSNCQRIAAPTHAQLLRPTIMSKNNVEPNAVPAGSRPSSPPVNSGQTSDSNANPLNINNSVALINCLIVVLLHLCVNLNTLVLRLNEYLDTVARNRRGHSPNQALIQASSSRNRGELNSSATSSAASTSNKEAGDHGKASPPGPADPPTPILAPSPDLESVTNVPPRSDIPVTHALGGASRDVEVGGATAESASAETGAHTSAALGAGVLSAAAESIAEQARVPHYPAADPDPDSSRLLDGITLDDIAISDGEMAEINAPSQLPAADAAGGIHPPPNSPIRDNQHLMDDDPPPQYESDDDVISIITSSEGSVPRNEQADEEAPNRGRGLRGVLRDEHAAGQPRDPSRESLRVRWAASVPSTADSDSLMADDEGDMAEGEGIYDREGNEINGNNLYADDIHGGEAYDEEVYNEEEMNHDQGDMPRRARRRGRQRRSREITIWNDADVYIAPASNQVKHWYVVTRGSRIGVYDNW